MSAPVPEIPDAESLTIEFKSDVERLNDDELVETVVCLANAEGGTLFIGVENDGVVTGLHASRPREISGLAAMVANRTAPSCQVRVGEFSVDGLRVAIVEVPRSGRIVARTDGLVKRRRLKFDGTPECVAFLPHEYPSRQADFRAIDMTGEPLAGASIDDFDPLQRERLRALIAGNPRSDKALAGLSDEELEGALQLTAKCDGRRQPTLLGLLLIGRTESLCRLVPTHEVLFQVLDGAQVRVNESSRSALVEVVEWLDLLSRGINTEQEFNEGLFRIGVARVDWGALREAYNNALVHRDYARRGAVRVCWEADQLIVGNPGGFVEGVTAATLLTTEPRPRNPALADAFKRLGLVERTGRGVDLIYSGMLRFGRPAPDYSASQPDMVKLVVSTEPADLGFVRLVLQEEAKQQGPLPVETLLVLTALRRSRRMATSVLAVELQRSEGQVRRICESLLERGLLVAQGTDRNRQYLLGPHLYRALGQHAEFIRQAGFSALQQGEMVKNYIREHGRIKRAQVVELCRIGPEEARGLLSRLLKEGEIELHGERRGSYYTLAPNKSKL